MSGRLQGKAVIVVGAGQTAGATIGNGRAAALLYGREGARVVAADRDLASAEETAELIRGEGGESISVRVDVTCEEDLAQMVGSCVDAFGGVDVLHNNVGVSVLGGDASVTEITAEAFSRLMATNLQSMVLASKYALPVMRSQGSGVIINISSNAALVDYPYIAYKTSKAGVIALTEHLAIRNAEYGIRANTILPGLMDTPMAVEYRMGKDNKTREQVIADRLAKTPLSGRPGNAWDVARAAVFLASDDASFITGAALVVDGGQSLAVG